MFARSQVPPFLLLFDQKLRPFIITFHIINKSKESWKNPDRVERQVILSDGDNYKGAFWENSNK